MLKLSANELTNQGKIQTGQDKGFIRMTMTSRNNRSALAGACIALFSAGLVCITPAEAQFGRRNNDELQDRIARIESAINDLQGVVYSVEGSAAGPQVTYGSGTIPNPDGYAEPVNAGNISVRMSQVERELQSLTGRIEELSYRIDQNASRLETITQALAASSSLSTNRRDPYATDPYTTDPDAVDLGGRAPSDLGAEPFQEGVNPYGASGPATGGPVTLGGSSPASLPPIENSGSSVVMTGDVNADYDTAFNALLNGDYQKAEEAFSAFLATYPDDPRSADAQFRLGEIYLATGANTKAARAFLDHVKKWPRDARSSESYLKLGTAYSRLGKTDEACKIFKVMEGKFPSASADVKQRLAVEKGNAGC